MACGNRRLWKIPRLMRLINCDIYIEFSLLIQSGLSSDTVKWGCNKYRKEKTTYWENIPDQDDKRKVLIKLDSIPQSSRSKFLAKHSAKSIEAWAASEAQRNLAELIKITDSDVQFFKDLSHENGKRYYSDKDCSALARSAAWLRFLSTLPRDKKTINKYGFESKSELLKAAHIQTTQIENLKGLRRVKSLRRFRDKITAFSKEENSCLVSGKFGNNNTKKLTPKAEKLLRQIYSAHNKFAFTQVWEKYMDNVSSEVCAEAYPEISLSTVKGYLRRPSVIMQCNIERHGKKVAKYMNEPTFKRRKPSYPHAMWVMDGTPIELYYQEDGKYWKRMYGFFVIDACTWNIVGYSLADSETSEMIFKACKTAALNTGYLPDQLQFDNSAAIKSKDMMEWYKTFTRYAIPTEVGNAKAKIIEPAFARFNESCLRQFDNYAGANITAKKLDSRVNDEWLKKNKQAIPDRAGVINQIGQAIEMWNLTHPLEGGSKARPLTLENRVEIFWKWRMKNRETRQTYGYRREGITIQIRNQKYDYAVYDAGDKQLDYKFWRHHAGKSFHVKYDHDDMSMIALYEGDHFVSYADAQRELPMAIVDYEKGEGDYVQGALSKRKEFWKDLEEDLAKDKIEAEGYLKAPFPIKGQQKDHYNHALEVIDMEPAKRTAKKKGLYDTEGDLEIIDFE